MSLEARIRALERARSGIVVSSLNIDRGDGNRRVKETTLLPGLTWRKDLRGVNFELRIKN